MARREASRGSLLSAVLGLGVLASVAFLVGGVAGLLWKEPGLLISYLRGDTTEIAFSTAAADVAPADPPPLAALPEPPAREARTRKPEKKQEKAAAPPLIATKRSNPPAVAAPPPPAERVATPGSIAVQVGAFSERSVADQLRQRLRDAGFPAYLTAAARAGDPWRVRVGPYGSRGEAEQIASRLKVGQKLPTWILDEDSAP